MVVEFITKNTELGQVLPSLIGSICLYRILAADKVILFDLYGPGLRNLQKEGHTTPYLRPSLAVALCSKKIWVKRL